MGLHRWENDDQLVDDLTRAWREVAPATDRVARLGYGALAWRSVDNDLLLASLSFDSLLEETTTSRDTGSGTRVLVFTASPLTVELERWSDRVAGQILPPGPAEVVVEAPDGTRTRVEADEFGFFLLASVPASPFRLRCDTETARLVTEWIQL